MSGVTRIFLFSINALVRARLPAPARGMRWCAPFVARVLPYLQRATVRRCGARAGDDCATTRKDGRLMKKWEAVLREEQKSADAQAVAPRDWSAIGARIRQWALTATAVHLAESAEAQRVVPVNEQKD